MTIKKAWITPADAQDLVTLTLESAHSHPEHRRILISELAFPRGTESRHTVKIALLDTEDLRVIMDCIRGYLEVAAYND